MDDNVTMSLDMGMDAMTTAKPRPDYNDLNRFSPSLMTLTAVLLTIFMIVGLFGNAITIVALLRCPRVRNVTAAFICSLCVADFSFCLLVLPLEISRFSNGGWTLGDGFMCVLFPLLRYWNVGCSLLSIAMITINRFVMIAFHDVYNKIYERRWVVVQIAFIWLFSFGMLVPPLAGLWGKFGFHPKLMTCSIVKVNGVSAKKTLFWIGFLIPCIAILICYIGIFVVIVTSDRRMRRHSERSGVKETSQQKKSRQERTRKNEMRITKMSLVIFITFLICYLPVTVAKLKDPFVKYPGLHILGYILVYLSACINPIIYVIMSRQYRQAYKTVLFCRRPRLFSDSSTHSKEERSKGAGQPSQTYMSQISNDSGASGGPALEDLPEVFTEVQKRKV